MDLRSITVKLMTLLSLVFCFFLLAEAGFRVSQRSSETSVTLGPADVVCIGSSPTVGAGAPPQKSYCHQLQDLAQGKGKKLVTQNWGHPDFNTSDMLRDIKAKTPLVKPKIALVMAGLSNTFTFRGYAEFLERQGANGTKAESGSIEEFLANHLALLKRYKEFMDPSSSLYPFKVTDPNNATEIAYRWLSWGRSNYPAHGLSEKQTINATESMNHIKAIDPSNVAADLFLAELEAVGFGDSEKALKTYRSVPKEYEACIALIEAPALKEGSEDLSTELNGYLTAITQKWDEKLPEQERQYIKDALEKFGQTGTSERLLAPTLLNNSPQIQSIFETLSDCGTRSDVTQVYLMGDRLRKGDFAALFTRIERQLQLLPLTPHLDLIQWLMMVRGVGLKSSDFNQRYENSKAVFEKKFGTGLTATIFVTPESVEAWTKAELTEIVEYLKGQNVEVILMTYPPLPFRGLHPIDKTPIEDFPAHNVDPTIRQVADATKTRLFDSYTILKNEFKGVKDLKEFYSLQMGPLDDHLNSAGYQALARELYSYLTSENLLK